MIKEILNKRIMILDGAMGTMIQKLRLGEDDFRGLDFAGHTTRLSGNNDILSITCPDKIALIHRSYLEAGADIIETNTFNAQSISQAEYGTQHYVRQINLAAAGIARREADRMTLLTPDRPRFVAGSVGPTGKTASMSPEVDDPSFRAVSFDMLSEAYQEQIEALIEGGVDLLLIETIFDTLNAKAAMEAARKAFAVKEKRLPVMLSVTVADAAGRTLSGQTLDAFVTSLAGDDVFSFGLNCSFGAEQMLPFLRQISALSPCYVSAYPNAGIPDAMGRYNETPQIMARSIRKFAEEGLVNIVGGCCGSTPEHISAICKALEEGIRPRRIPEVRLPWLAGLEGFDANGAFINVGERCNVAGSRKFLRLIGEKSYDEALSIARKQVRDGAMVLDINMDDGMLDTRAEMVNFLNLMASDPEIARVPWMIDSSRFVVVEAALKCIQGKAIVNSLSLKEGEELFISRARRVRELGAALVVMAFDERGQATTYERKIEVCARAYRILTLKVGFRPQDIIFDPNVLTVATGMKEHDRYALDFIEAARWIHQNLPGAKVSGGISNLSFAFRGNNYLREAMHAVFLYHAIKAGLDMAIVNPAAKVMYSDIPADLLDALEDVILCRRDDASERLVDIAARYKDISSATQQAVSETCRNDLPVEQRLIIALQRGDDEFLDEDIHEALSACGSPQAVIDGPLMQGMKTVGELFGAGKMFLPQVVKTARIMKQATDILKPYIMSGSADKPAGQNGNYLLATVKGDVHDIGKNIVAVVLACNNFNVTDLGVMVTAEQIVKAVHDTHADFIGLSGLITPSLDEMCHIASELKHAGISVPLFIGGATTSAMHTAVRIAPLYDGPVFHVRDAAQNPILAMQLCGKEREHVVACLRFEQEQLRQQMQRHETTSLTEEEALRLRPVFDWKELHVAEPSFLGKRNIAEISIAEIRHFINWIYFYRLWGVRRGTAEAAAIKEDAERFIDSIKDIHHMQAQVAFHKAHGTATSIVVEDLAGHTHEIFTPRQRKPGTDGTCRALCDFVAPAGEHTDHVGVFAVTVSPSFIRHLEDVKKHGDQYSALLMQSVGDRLAEAASEWLHARVRRTLWGYAPDEHITVKEMYSARFSGIRPAAGYPSLPDQRVIFTLRNLVDFDSLGISLTENGAMYPQSSVCGLYIANPKADYFIV